MHIQKWFQLRGFYSEEKVDQLIEITKQAKLEAGGIIKDGKSVISRRGRNCMSGWIHKNKDNVWVFADILRAVEDINKRTLKFDLTDCSIEPLQYLEYGPFQFYNEHVDNGARTRGLPGRGARQRGRGLRRLRSVACRAFALDEAGHSSRI